MKPIDSCAVCGKDADSTEELTEERLCRSCYDAGEHTQAYLALVRKRLNQAMCQIVKDAWAEKFSDGTGKLGKLD